MNVKNNRFEQLAEFSSNIRQLTLKRLKEVPSGFINWRLNNSAMSFVHLVQHIINVDDIFFSITKSTNKKYTWILGSEELHINVYEKNYESLIKKLQDYKEKRHTIICSFDDTIINDQVTDENGKKMTLWWFLMHHVLEHEVYHRGQIAAYLKILKGESAGI